MKSILALILLGTLLFAEDEAFELNHKTRNYDQKHIHLDISLDFKDARVWGTATIDLVPIEDDFDELILHSESTEVNSVRINGKPCEHRIEGGLLYIAMGKSHKTGAQLKVAIEYEARPATGLYFFHPTEANPTVPIQVWSQGQSEDNHHWFPAYDKPDDRLTSAISVTVPSSMRAFSNGDLMRTEENSNKKETTFHWETDFEHSVYLMALVAGDFKTVTDTVRGIPLNYNMPADAAHYNPDLAFVHTPEMFLYYSDYIAPYPYKRYDQHAVQDFRYGGMENTTATILNKRIFHDEKAVQTYSPEGLIAHELVHQWFGDLLTCKTWDHIWLNEGMTSYFTDMFFEHYYGVTEFRKRRLSQDRGYARSLRWRKIDKVEPSEDGVTPIELSGGKAYSKGAAVTHMLRGVVGDENFQKGIQTYVNRFAYKNVVSEDLRAVMEEVSGKDLSQFFKQWIYGAGLPEFEVRWEWDEEKSQMLLFVAQVQDTFPAMDVFVVDAAIEITAGQEVIHKTAAITGRKHQFSYNLPEKPQLVRFDKGNWILKKLDFEKSLAELRYQLLYDDDVIGRYLAAEQLGKKDASQLNLLSRAYQRESYYWVRDRILSSAADIDSVNSLALVKLGAHDLDARVRRTAMGLLARYDADEVTDILLHHMKHDRNEYVQAAAISAYAKLGVEDAGDIMLSHLQTESHANIIRRSAMTGLKDLDDKRFFDHAEEFCKYKYSNGSSHSLESSILRSVAALAEDYPEEARDVAVAALKNRFHRTRAGAARTLARIDAKDAVDEIRKILKHEQREFVRRPLEAAIEELEKPEEEEEEPAAAGSTSAGSGSGGQ